ncbi:MAG: type I methionyl aminopeptidase [Elusimicrobia bacterium]|nr:type I methionyl aminopeptidase [Elusimicrobiota bacterium]
MSRTAAPVINVKSKREIAKIRQACRIAAATLAELVKIVKPGVSTAMIDEAAQDFLSRYPGARAAFYGYRGFPGHVCVSINAEVVHGVPRKNRIVREGDLVSLDWGVSYDGFFGDCAATAAAGRISESAERLVALTRQCLDRAINVVKPGAAVGDIGHAIQSHAQSNGANVIRDYVGHGIGRSLHEEPAIPNWGEPGKGARLIAGMTIAVEPMVTLGSGAVQTDGDGWTAKTKDNALTAHFEHTLLVTDEAAEILTLNGHLND